MLFKVISESFFQKDLLSLCKNESEYVSTIFEIKDFVISKIKRHSYELPVNTGLFIGGSLCFGVYGISSDVDYFFVRTDESDEELHCDKFAFLVPNKKMHNFSFELKQENAFDYKYIVSTIKSNETIRNILLMGQIFSNDDCFNDTFKNHIELLLKQLANRKIHELMHITIMRLENEFDSCKAKNVLTPYYYIAKARLILHWNRWLQLRGLIGLSEARLEDLNRTLLLVRRFHDYVILHYLMLIVSTIL